jgi:hypothetical protein
MSNSVIPDTSSREVALIAATQWILSNANKFTGNMTGQQRADVFVETYKRLQAGMFGEQSGLVTQPER